MGTPAKAQETSAAPGNPRAEPPAQGKPVAEHGPWGVGPGWQVTGIVVAIALLAAGLLLPLLLTRRRRPGREV